MKLINVNYLTPLAACDKYTDLGQFGLPNIFSSIPRFSNSQASTSSNNNKATDDNSSDSSLFITNAEGGVIFNDYFDHSFSQVFLDNYGGIVFSTCTTLMLYLLVKVVSKCFKDENSKIKKILLSIVHSFERSIIMALLVSRYMYLCSALILNYAFIPLNGTYQQLSLAVAIIYTIVLVFILVLSILVVFYHVKIEPR